MLKRLKKAHTSQLSFGFMNTCTHKSPQEIYIHFSSRYLKVAPIFTSTHCLETASKCPGFGQRHMQSVCFKTKCKPLKCYCIFLCFSFTLSAQIPCFVSLGAFMRFLFFKFMIINEWLFDTLLMFEVEKCFTRGKVLMRRK